MANDLLSVPRWARKGHHFFNAKTEVWLLGSQFSLVKVEKPYLMARMKSSLLPLFKEGSGSLICFNEGRKEGRPLQILSQPDGREAQEERRAGRVVLSQLPELPDGSSRDIRVTGPQSTHYGKTLVPCPVPILKLNELTLWLRNSLYPLWNFGFQVGKSKYSPPQNQSPKIKCIFAIL